MEVEIWITGKVETIKRRISYETQLPFTFPNNEEGYFQISLEAAVMVEEELKGVFAEAGLGCSYEFGLVIVTEFFEEDDYDKAMVRLVCGNRVRTLCCYFYRQLEQARRQLRKHIKEIPIWYLEIFFGKPSMGQGKIK